MLTGLNHITVATGDLKKSLTFYVALLGFKLHATWDGGAYLSIGELWLCLSCDESFPARDYTHIAFTIEPENFLSFADTLLTQGVKQWKHNKSEGESLYILDPDGHKLEIHVGDLQSRLMSMDETVYKNLVVFN